LETSLTLYLSQESLDLDRQLAEGERQVELFRRERDRWVERMRARERRLGERQGEEEERTHEIRGMIIHGE